MRCSVCNKNTAVIFINKPGSDKNSVEGLCYSCAKKKGINPLEILAKNANISNEEIENLSGQFENILKDFSENMNLESIGIDSIEDLQNRAKVSTTLIERLRDMHILDGLPESSQLSLF